MNSNRLRRNSNITVIITLQKKIRNLFLIKPSLVRVSGSNMSTEEQLSPESGIKSLTTAVAIPREFRAHTHKTHFDKSTERVDIFRFYCILTVCFAEDVEIQHIRGPRY